MTSYRQIEANRRNALKSTGPRTETGKQVSRCNAVRHGLTAETVLSALEDAEDYKAFEAAITADYDAQSAVERELVLRLASILWRLRSATTMETGLFEIHARQPHDDRQNRQLVSNSREVIPTMFRRAESANSPRPTRNVRARPRRWITAKRDDANFPSQTIVYAYDVAPYTTSLGCYARGGRARGWHWPQRGVAANAAAANRTVALMPQGKAKSGCPHEPQRP
jgi:hypothetical protein